MDTTQTYNAIVQSLYDKKGFNILTLDLTRLDIMVDYCVICEGNVDRHVKSLAHNVTKDLEQAGVQPLYRDGMNDADWIVLDYGEVVVHVMTPDMRERYCLEELWREASVVNVELDTEARV